VTASARFLDRDVVLARGADAASYLQGQLSQDVEALAVGDSAFALLLQPQGKVDAFLRVTRWDDDVFVLDVDAGWGDAVVARLKRFLLRVKVELEQVDWKVLAVRGASDEAMNVAGRTVLPETPGVDGFDVIGPGAAVQGELPVLDAATYESMRIRAGVPRMGNELDESTIPAAAGVVDRSVSFTKGCYTGQELVARIDSRGDRTPTKLRGIVGDAPVGATLAVAGRDIGRVTSSAAGVALGYVRREVELPAAATATWEGGESTVSVEALPLAQP
jgi:folate-binding protein YgfZ